MKTFFRFILSLVFFSIFFMPSFLAVAEGLNKIENGFLLFYSFTSFMFMTFVFFNAIDDFVNRHLNK